MTLLHETNSSLSKKCLARIQKSRDWKQALTLTLIIGGARRWFAKYAERFIDLHELVMKRLIRWIRIRMVLECSATMSSWTICKGGIPLSTVWRTPAWFPSGSLFFPLQAIHNSFPNLDWLFYVDMLSTQWIWMSRTSDEMLERSPACITDEAELATWWRFHAGGNDQHSSFLSKDIFEKFWTCICKTKSLNLAWWRWW